MGETTYNGRPVYKVVGADAESIHGGELTWSLPVVQPDGTITPGDWHAVTGTIRVCRNGLHLTTEPIKWWRGDSRVFAVEFEGDTDDEGDDKVAVRRARLRREEAWESFGVYTAGAHQVTSGRAIAFGSATVRAFGSATVRAFGSATVEASGSATVRAFDSATVEAFGSATVRAFDSATVEASGSATVEALGSATVEASDSATVRAFGSATVEAFGSATVEASGSATVEAFGSATVRAFDSATVEAFGSANVIRTPYHRAGWVRLANSAALIDRRNGVVALHAAPWSDAPEDGAALAQEGRNG